MAELIAQGELGVVRLFRSDVAIGEFVDAAIPFDWRFERAWGGTTIADLGSHLVDLAILMVGPVAKRLRRLDDFYSTPLDSVRPAGCRRRRRELSRCASPAVLVGPLSGGHVAPRRPCDFVLEVNGDRGTAVFDYARLNELWVGSSEDDPHLYGLRRVRAEHVSHPETAGWWPIGQGVGYDASLINQAADLAAGWKAGNWSPDFAQGARVPPRSAQQWRSRRPGVAGSTSRPSSLWRSPPSRLRRHG